MYHIDWTAPWNPEGPTNAPIDGGHDFSTNWRYNIPGVHQYALGLRSFRTAPNSMLSFETIMEDITTTGCRLKIVLVGNNSHMVFLIFSILIITENSPYLELITIE